MKSLQALIANLAIAVLLPGLSYADTSPTVVGEDGTVLKLHSGTYGDLFPEEVEVDPENRVLALDVLRPSGTERLLVPNTESREPESIAALYFGKSSGLTYLLWEGLVNGAHPFFNLVSFDGAWSEVIPIAGTVYADKGPAELVIVPESDPQPKAAQSAVAMPSKRTVIYVAWQELIPNGSVENYLAPIILEDGEYMGWRQVFNLSSLLGSSNAEGHNGPPTHPVLDSNLFNILTVQPSTKGNAIVVGFINQETERLVTLEFEMLPLALSALADRVRGYLLQYGESSSSLEQLITQVQSAILADGSEFHPSILEYLANEIGDLLAEHSTVAAAIAPGVLDKAGVYMIGVGARVRTKGLVDLEPLGIFALGQEPTGGAPYHYLKVSSVAERDVPAVDGLATLFLSRTGDQALVAWANESAVLYRETQGESWGETQRVELRNGLDKEAVYRILSERTLNR